MKTTTELQADVTTLRDLLGSARDVARSLASATGAPSTAWLRADEDVAALRARLRAAEAELAVAEHYAVVPEALRPLARALGDAGFMLMDLSDAYGPAPVLHLCAEDGTRIWTVRPGPRNTYAVLGARSCGGEWPMSGGPDTVGRMLAGRASDTLRRERELATLAAPAAEAPKADVPPRQHRLEVREADGRLVAHVGYEADSSRQVAALRSLMRAPGRQMIAVLPEGEAARQRSTAEARPRRAAEPNAPAVPRIEVRAPGGEAIYAIAADEKAQVLLAGRRLFRAWTKRSAQCSAWLLDEHGEVEVTALLAALRRDAAQYTSRGVSDLRANAADLRRRAEAAMNLEMAA